MALLVAAGGLGYLLVLKKPSAPAGPSAAQSAPASGKNSSVSPVKLPNATLTSNRIPGREGGSRGSSGAGAREASGAAGLGEAPGAARPDKASAIAALADLRAAIGASDYDKMAYAESRLRSYIAGDEARALEVLEMFKAETDPGVLSILAGVLASDPAATGSAALASAMAALAEDPAAAGPQREQALVFLAQSTGAPGEIDRRIAALAAGGNDPALRQAALAALSSRANTAAPERAAEMAGLLLQTLRAERDPEMRAVFMAGVPLRESSATVVGEVVDAMRRDTAAGVREAAAHALGDAPASQRQQVVEELERSFRSESDLGARRAMLISMIRQTGPNALGAIERLRPLAGSAQPDCDDYIAVIRSGETQADRIFELKFGREMARGGPVEGSDDHHD